MTLTPTDQLPAPQPAPSSTPTQWSAVPRVNLLPPEIIDARRFVVVRRRLGIAVLAAVAACAAVTFWAQAGVTTAQDELNEASARTGVLNTEQARYAEVPKLTAAVESALSSRERAMAADVLWHRYLSDVALASSSTIWLTSLQATVTGATPVTGADPLAPAGIGQVSIKGQTTALPTIAKWLESLDQITGLKGTTLIGSTREGTTSDAPVNFETTSVLTPDALSHRYDRKAR